ncbi:MAG: hypothetical protein ABI884_14165 [Gemmatimonadota bacterium]
MFLLENSDGVTNWDALLELATVNPATGNEQLLALSDDEGPHGWSRMYILAPVSGPFYIRGSGYDISDTSGYKLTAKSCDSPIAEITGRLTASAQTLSSTDCVLAQMPPIRRVRSPRGSRIQLQWVGCLHAHR